MYINVSLINSLCKFYLYSLVFWVGDFNYRLSLPIEMSIERILEQIEIHQQDGVFTEIYEYDQVRHYIIYISVEPNT